MIDLFWTKKVLVDHGLWVGLLIFFFPLDLTFLSAFTSFANESTNISVEWYLFSIHSQQRLLSKRSCEMFQPRSIRKPGEGTFGRGFLCIIQLFIRLSFTNMNFFVFINSRDLFLQVIKQKKALFQPIKLSGYFTEKMSILKCTVW